MRALSQGDSDTPIVSGESAAGGMGVLLKAASDPQLASQLRLTPSSQVVLFGCEGATDPVIFEQITGLSPSQVFERQSKTPAILVP